MVRAGVIDENVAGRINSYFAQGERTGPQRVYLVFGILGALLVGLGLMLIIAHNWDDLPRLLKTFFAFLPLLVGQGAVVYSLVRKKNDLAWREGSAAFLVCAVGACLSLVSQIYHLKGDLSEFMLTWVLLIIPLVYVLRSSMASLMYLMGITFYGADVGYWNSAAENYLYWVLLLLAVPHYYGLISRRPTSNFTTFHNWAVPLSIIAILGTLAAGHAFLMFVAYMGLFGVLYLVGQLAHFDGGPLRNNGYRVLGSVGMVLILLFASFSWFWEEAADEGLQWNGMSDQPEVLALLLIGILWATLLFLVRRPGEGMRHNPVNWVFPLFVFIYALGVGAQDLATVLINSLVLFMGVFTIFRGTGQDHLGILNYGLLIVTALIFCRFFDTDLSFIFRGLLLVGVGVGFFLFNTWFLRRRNDSVNSSSSNKI